MPEYREIPGFPGYRVGDDGTVWSRRRRGSYRLRESDPWKLLSATANRDGYLIISLRQERRKKTMLVNRLVLLAFVGPPPTAAHEAAHGNGVRNDNRVGNLRWATHRENSGERHLHGPHPRAKLTPGAVVAIRRLRRAGHTYAALAERFGVVVGVIRDAVKLKTWKHVRETEVTSS